jgi:trehalose-6-phosphatase
MNAANKLALIVSAAAFALPQTAIAKSAPLSKAWSGTWRLNTAKSNFSSPDTTQKSETRSYTVSGNRVTMRSNSVNAAGKIMRWSYSAATDGKWYPTTGNPNTDHIALTWVSDREVKSKTQLHGKPSANASASVSADGKVLTIDRSILTARGGPSHDTLVFDRAK